MHNEVLLPTASTRRRARRWDKDRMTKLRSILCLLVIPMLTACHGRNEGQPAMLGKLNAVAAAVELFKLDHDRLPAKLDELLPATHRLGGGALSGYIRPEGLVDSWGQRLHFTVNSNCYEIRSAGRDCTLLTTDDFVKRGKQ